MTTWLRLTPPKDYAKKPRKVADHSSPDEAEKRAPMRWWLDPKSPAADALRALKRKLSETRS